MGTGTSLPLAPAEMLPIRTTLRGRFPNLSESFAVTSERTFAYNCIAWAAGDTTRWWWPTGLSYWPVGAAREETVEAFVAAFRTLGYATCATGELEAGLEKVALFADGSVLTHMARQLPNGSWTSKLGKSWDIAHMEPEEVGGKIYGAPILFLARPLVSP